MTDLVTFSGAEELNAVLKELNTEHPKIGTRITRSVLQAGATETAKRQRRKAPKGTIRKAIGSKVKKRRKQWTAKAGGNVGRKRGTAPHFHLNTLGTKTRKTKSGANRGRMRTNDFMRAATRNPKPIVEKMRKRLVQRIEIEVAKRAKQQA